MAKKKPAAKPAEPAVMAVMAAGAAEQNVENVAAPEEEGSRDAKGHFTGKPPSDSERLDRLEVLARKNGWSM